MKKSIIALFFATVFFFSAMAQEYQITNVEYNLDGRTKPYALGKNLDIRTDTVFESVEQLDEYIEYVRQNLMNQRVLQESSLEYTMGEQNEYGIIPVTLVITARDTWNIFPVPYPKYNSNSGFEFKLKVKDYNFFGSMEPLNFDVVYYQEDEGETHNIGVGFDFSIPFALGIFDAVWNTDASLDYTFGASKPGFGFKTGLDISFPTRFVNFHLIANQSVKQDLDYESTNDELYITEYVEFNAPFTVLRTTNLLDNIVIKPYVSFTYNWDLDGITHLDLKGPSLGFGVTASIGKVNWISNFRNGIVANIKQSVDYNFGYLSNKWKPRVSGEIIGHYATEHVGFGGRIKAFTYYGMSQLATDDIGSEIRGIRDSDSYNSGQLDTSSAIILNTDISIKVIQTDWRKWGKRLFKKDMPSWLSFFDFELQVVPFLDIALTRNTVTGRLLNPKDGFYGTGLELIVFPSRMRSIQVRGSVGVDLSHYISDAEWRTKTKPEIEIGVGLHY